MRVALALAAVLAACGVKAPPRPPVKASAAAPTPSANGATTSAEGATAIGARERTDAP